MENPATWGPAELVVDQILGEHFAEKKAGEFIVGLSLTRRITDALRSEGLLVESDG